MKTSELTAKILAGAWRALPPPLEVSDHELVRVMPLLL
jgi:hypothetical protein